MNAPGLRAGGAPAGLAAASALLDAAGPSSVDGEATENLPTLEAPAWTPPATPSRAATAAISRGRAALPTDVPAWAVSLLIHLGVLGLLAVATLSNPELLADFRRLDLGLVDTRIEPDDARDMTLYADPGAIDDPRGTSTSAMPWTPTEGDGLGPVAAGIAGVALRVETPVAGAVAESSGSVLIGLPGTLGRGLGGGRVRGDTLRAIGDPGQALDQLAAELIHTLADSKMTVVWMFDESASMRDDQQILRGKFDRVVGELKLNLDANRKPADVLAHAVVGFGAGIHYVQDRPTGDVVALRKAIDWLPLDDTGKEFTMQAVAEVLRHYGRVVPKDRKLVLVVVTDESGDDGQYVEEALAAANARGVAIHVIGRQALFGHGSAFIAFHDRANGETYWPEMRRGPESAEGEVLQFDGLVPRRDEQPSGFPPYELARLTRRTGGVYFLLPNEEGLRRKPREAIYDPADLKEYEPEYDGRDAYERKVRRSPLRSAIRRIVHETKDLEVPLQLSSPPAKLAEEAAKALEPLRTIQRTLALAERDLRDLAKFREQEPERRWQAHYDLMLAQVVAYRIRALEYEVCLADLVRDAPRPATVPGKNQEIVWDLRPTRDLHAAGVRADEAERLLQRVIDRYPRTPWADLARDEIDRGQGVARFELARDTHYVDRSKLVPKY